MTISSTDTSTYFRQTENRYKKYAMKRSRHYEREEELSDKIKSGVGAVIGTAIPMAIMMKKRGIKNPLKLKYDLQDMVVLSATSVAGGVGVEGNVGCSHIVGGDVGELLGGVLLFGDGNDVFFEVFGALVGVHRTAAKVE